MDENNDENAMVDETPVVVRRQYTRRPQVPVIAAPAEPPVTEPEVIAAKPAKPARDTSNDFGNWKYRPWKGIPHWVHGPSGRSTFDRSEAKKLKRL